MKQTLFRCMILYICSNKGLSFHEARKLSFFVVGKPIYDHMTSSQTPPRIVDLTPVLKELTWLPVATQLHFRDTVMVFKC